MAKPPPPPKKKKTDPPAESEVKNNLSEKEYMMLRIKKETHHQAKIKSAIHGKRLIDYIEMLINNDDVKF
jgi:predicted HicB family RNase H-like nuclease